MTRYDLTEDGYRRKFRASKAETDESGLFTPVLKNLHERAPKLSSYLHHKLLPKAFSHVYRVTNNLIIGNIPGARHAKDPNPSWQTACAVMTRSQAKKGGKHMPLRVAGSSRSAIVKKNELVKLQHEDKNLEEYWDRKIRR